jgi:hypothetical protein
MARPFSAETLFTHHDSHPVVLASVLVEHLDPEWVLWEPETLREEILSVFKKSDISTLVWQKIQAVRTCIAVESPWKNYGVFAVVLQPINNNLVDFVSLQQPTLAQCAFAVTVLQEIDDHVFSDEVERFVAAEALDDGVVCLPRVLSFAQEWVTEPRYRCACGWVGDAREVDTCWRCGGSSLKRFSVFDPSPVQKRYDEFVKKADRSALSLDDGIDVQVSKLLMIDGYLSYRNRLKTEQTDVLKQAGLLRGDDS